MHSVKQFAESQHRLFRLLSFAGLLVFLAACSSNTAPPEPPQVQSSGDFAYVAPVDISADVTAAELEASYGGSIILYKPDSGFAVLGFTKEAGELSTLATAPNQGTVQSPAANAAGHNAWAGGHNAWAGGHNAWAGGYNAWAGGYKAWAGGFNAWAGGFNAWAGGFNAWAGGIPTSSVSGNNLHAFEAVNLAKGQLLAPKLGSGVKIAIIDTGIVTNHPAFSGQLVHSSQQKDFVDGDNNPWDNGGGSASGHGTAVAGILAQVAPNAQLLPIRVLDTNGLGDVDNIVLAIEWAVQQGADIINLSASTSHDVAALRVMLNYAASQGVLTVTATGNEGNTKANYPARWANENNTLGAHLISVGSTNTRMNVSNFSNRNAEVYAPGETLLTATANRNGQAQMTNATGTSFATPLVAGSLALALADAPGIHLKSQFAHFINEGARDMNGANPGMSGLGWGALDVERFLERAGRTAPAPGRSALYVLGSNHSVDRFFVSRLELLGFSVTRADEYTVQASDANGKDLIVISHTVSGSSLAAKFKHSNLPLITWEDGIYDDLGMATVSGDAWTSGALSLNAHNLTGGYAGYARVYAGGNRLAYGVVSNGATVVGTVPGDSNKATLFTYERGTWMASDFAHGKRVGLFFQSYDEHDYTALSATIFDTAVVWSTLDRHTVEGHTMIEAEAPSRVAGSGFSWDSNHSVSGGALMTTPNHLTNNAVQGSRLDYDLKAAADTYYVWLRAGGPDYNSDSFRVSIDGATPTDVHTSAIGTSAWFKVPSSFSLNGDHTLNVHTRESGAWLDNIVVTSDPNFTPATKAGN